MSKQFVHLHSHSDHSVLDGHASYKGLAEEVARLGQPGFSITDHGSMSNTYNGWKIAKSMDLAFIPGIEAYVTPGDASRMTKEPIFFGSGDRENKEERSNDVSGGGAYTHMTLLAETTEGMHNLFRLNTLAWQDGYYKKNRMDIESIASMSNGIIGTTGCPSGELQTRLRLGQWKEALAYASKMQDIFGKDNYFLELMDHNMSIDLERRVRADLMKVASELNIPLLATNDLHYVRREDAKDHEHMLCIQSGSSMNEQPYDRGGKRFAFEGEEYYAKSAEEMLLLFPEDEYPGAISNTLWIAERSQAEFKYDATLRPSVPLPDGHTEDSFLRQEVYEGLARKRPDKVNDPEYIARLEKELEVLSERRFSGYMLVVSDFMRWAKAQGWECGPARGSGGGSLIAFCTDITEIDPIPHGLIFERFLNPERDSPPDIDSDFDDVHRELVIDYVRKKYGEETVAMIITFGMIKAKSAIKDVARIFEEPYSVGETLTKALPAPVSGKEITLKEAFDPTASRYPEAEMFREEASRNKRIIDAAMGIEGKMRSTSVHAAGVIMSSKPLRDIIPLMMRQADGVMITQFDYPTCEDLGLIKMDFLGIRNLTVVQKCIEAVKRNHGVVLNTRDIYDSVLVNPDQKTFDMLNRGETLGVFQLDGPGITSLVRLINVTSFNDISAILALYRPGPMGMNSHINYAERKNGRQKVEPIHPELAEVLEPILGETQNIVVFQEQIQFIAQKIANYSLGEADILRRAMGKKKKAEMDAQWGKFSEGAKANGYSLEATQVLWDTLVPFAEYGFNKTLKWDTRVERMSSNQYDPDPTISLQEIWDRFYGKKANTHVGKKYRKQGFVIRGLDPKTNMITRKRVVDIHDHGVLKLFKITLEDGRQISASINHRHMTDAGWKTVGELASGDSLMVDSLTKISHLGDTYIREDRVLGLGQGWAGKSEKRAIASDGYIRPVLHGLSASLKSVKAQLPDYCEKCGETEGRLEAAHMNHDRSDNSRENVKRLCNSCHKKHDGKRRGGPWAKGTLPRFSKIVSIDYDGMHQAYDLEVEGETETEHNYVANGVVTHNSHSAGYGLLSYLTAYLKANYPAEFMAANLSTLTGDKEKTAAYLDECRHLGIKVLPPSVSRSTADYTATKDGTILVGLQAIRGVGAEVATDINTEVRENGEYKSLDEFLSRAPAHALSKTVLEGLAHSGALDGYGYSRRTLFEDLPEAAKGFAKAKKKQSQGQFSLFDEIGDDESVSVDLPSKPEYIKKDKLAFERHVLGLYVSDHPLSGIANMLERYADTQAIQIISGQIRPAEGGGFGDRKKLTLAGVANNVVKRQTRAGGMMATFTIEDISGSIPCLIFPKAFERLGSKIFADGIFSIRGSLLPGESENDIKFAVDDIREVEVTDSGLIPFVINIHESQAGEQSLEELESVLKSHPGEMPVYINVRREGGGVQVFQLPEDKNVAASSLLVREVMSIFGSNSVVS